jgi:hypothetical protein
MLLFNAFKVLKNCLAAFLIVFVYASVSFAAADDLSLQSDAIAVTTGPANESSIEQSAVYKIDGVSGDLKSEGSGISVLGVKNIPIGSLKGYIEKICSIPLRKDGDTVILSLAPSFDTFSLRPSDDIKNFQAVLKYRF